MLNKINSDQQSQQISNINSSEINFQESYTDSFTGLFNKRFQFFTKLTILITNQKLDLSWKNLITEALQEGITLYQIEESILHLGIYVGLPRSLQCFQELKNLGLISTIDQKSSANKNQGLDLGVARFVPSQFNFFQQPDIQDALYSIHPDFGWLAGMAASALCSRGTLSPLERAHITLVSDICQNVFKGPFQIHVRMVLQSGGNVEFMKESIRFLKHISHAEAAYSVPNQNLLKAEETLPEAISTHQAFL